MIDRGSKTPFSYKRSSGEKYFYISTVADGIHYEYIYHFVESAPTLQLLNSYPDLVSPSGTKISIDIEAKDYYNVIGKLKSQTAYFSNVFINHNDFDNEFLIYEKENYLFRNTNSYSNKIHLVVGEVPYPINFDIIGSKYSYDLPIGLKFNVGEIIPVPNRENIIYDDRTCDLIRLKILATVKEISQTYEKQNSNITTLDEFMQFRKRGKYLKFENDLGSYDFLNVQCLDLEKYLIFKPLEGIEFNNFSQLFGEYKTLYFMSNRGRKSGNSSMGTQWHVGIESGNYNPESSTSYLWINERSKINKWDTAENYRRIGKNFEVVYYKKLPYVELIKKLGLRRRSFDNFIRIQPHFYDENGVLDKRKVKKEYKEHYQKLNPVEPTFFSSGKANKIIAFRKLIKEFVDSKVTTQYNVLSHQEIEELIQEEKDKNKTVRVVDKTIVFYKDQDNSSRIQTTIAELKKPFILFYVLDEDAPHIHQLLTDYKILLNRLKWRSKIQFVFLNKTNYQKVKRLKNLVHVLDFFKIDNFKKYFKHLQLVNLIDSNFNVNYTFEKNTRNISDYYYNLYRNIHSYKLKWYNSNTNLKYEKYKSQILKVIGNYEGDYLIKQKIKEFQEYRKKMNMLNWIDNSIPTNYLVEIVKNKKVLKLNSNFYGTSKVSTSGTEPDISSGSGENDEENS